MSEARPPLLRVLLFVAIVVHMQVGSANQQLLGGPRLPFAANWQMYTGAARDVCRVGWYTSGPDGPEPIDRLATLGLVPVGSAPKPGLLQYSEEEVRQAATELCTKLGPGADVRADARCGLTAAGGWRPVLAIDEPLCGPGAEP